jgi:tetratricopeptide (TPR) repeat protein
MSEADLTAMRAAELMNANRLGEAEKLYREAISQDKSNGQYYARLAEVQTKQIRPAHAFLTALDGVQQASHGKAWLYSYIGDYFAAHQDRLSALHWFEKSVSTAIQEGEDTHFLTIPLLFNYFVTGEQKRGIKFISGLNLPAERRRTLTAILSAQDLKNKLQVWLTRDLKTIRDLCRQHGARLFLVTYPLQDDRFGVNDQIAELASKLGVPLVDNQKRFMKMKTEPDFMQKYFAPDGHCNDAGYGLMADTAYRVLEEHGFK